jgi:hypothetical protein
MRKGEGSVSLKTRKNAVIPILVFIAFIMMRQ